MHIYRTVNHIRGVFPQALYYCRAGKIAPRLLCEKSEDVELLARQVDFPGVDGYRALVEIDVEPQKISTVRGLFLRAGPLQYRLDPGQHFVDGKGLGYVVVSSGREACQKIVLAGTGRKENNRNVSEGGTFQPSGELEAGLSRQHHVQKQKGRAVCQQLLPLFGAPGGKYAVARVLQVETQDFAYVLIVFNN